MWFLFEDACDAGAAASISKSLRIVSESWETWTMSNSSSVRSPSFSSSLLWLRSPREDVDLVCLAVRPT